MLHSAQWAGWRSSRCFSMRAAGVAQASGGVMKFAFVGGGMVGQCWGRALASSGLTLVGMWDAKPSPSLHEMTAATGAVVHDSAGNWLSGADIVFSAVYGGAALDVAGLAAGHLRPGALYVDMTTADPNDMVRAAEQLKTQGVDFVDVAITGAVDVNREKTPLLCSGQRAQAVAEVFRRVGSPIQVVGARPGDATSLKLLRSVFTKGIEALTIECLATAEQRGLREQLHEILSDMDQMPLRKLMESIVRTHIPHADRRRKEVAEAERQVRLTGIDPVVLPAVRQLFERTVRQQQATPFQGTGTDEALRWLINAAGPHQS